MPSEIDTIVGELRRMRETQDRHVSSLLSQFKRDFASAVRLRYGTCTDIDSSDWTVTVTVPSVDETGVAVTSAPIDGLHFISMPSIGDSVVIADNGRGRWLVIGAITQTGSGGISPSASRGQILSDVTAGVAYIGSTGSATALSSQPAWTIQKITLDPTTGVELTSGWSVPSSVWDNRATLVYT